MSKIMYDVLVPIPSYVKEHRDGNPSVRDIGRINLVYVCIANGKRTYRRVGVKADTPGMMHPNSQYFTLFGGASCNGLQEGNIVAEENAVPHYPVRRVGLFAVVCAIAMRLGILPILVQTHGIHIACAILDYACFLIASSCNSTYRMTCELYDHVLFTSPAYSDSWYSKLFCDVEFIAKNNLFQDTWIRFWISRGISDIYVISDTAIRHCDLEEHEVAERGQDKAISFLWAVIASGKDKGIPIAHVADPGSQPDDTAIQKVIAKLRTYGLEVKGVLLDQGFCTAGVMEGLLGRGISFTIAMPDWVDGHTQMVCEHGEEIREHPQYYIGENRYGTVDRVAVFQKEDMEANVALFYDPRAAALQRTDLVSGAHHAKQTVEKALANGAKCNMSNKYAQYLIIEKDSKSVNDGKCSKESDVGERSVEVTIDHKKLYEAMCQAGYSAIASSEAKSAKEIREISNLRKASKLASQYAETPLGEESAGAYSTVSARAKMFVSEIAAAIYTDLANTCASLDLEPAEAILELEEIYYLLSDNIYVFSGNLSDKARTLLQEFNVHEDALRKYEVIINKRYFNANSGIRTCTSLEECLMLVKTTVPRIPEIPSPSEQTVWDFIMDPTDQREQDEKSALEADENSAQGKDRGISLTEEPDHASNEVSGSLPARKGITGHESDAGKRDTLPGERTPANAAAVSPQENGNDTPRRRGRPKGSKDAQPRTRRTNAELGKPTKYPPKQSTFPASSKRGRPPGRKGSYKRQRRKRSGQPESDPAVGQ